MFLAVFVCGVLFPTSVWSTCSLMLVVAFLKVLHLMLSENLQVVLDEVMSIEKTNK